MGAAHPVHYHESHPVQSQLLQRVGNEFLRVGSSEMQGFRTTMEDTHTIRLSLSKTEPNLSFFGIYDGHGGDKASLYLSQQLVESVAGLSDPTHPTLLSNCLVECDNEFLKHEEERNEGSACIMALVRSPAETDTKSDRKYGITIANVGDSRALLIRGTDGKMMSLSNDHKPDLEAEHDRIMEADGFVRSNRVDGILAMSRAFGDWQFKANPSRKAQEQKVIAVPEILTETASDGDILLICCDGIFEALSNEQVAQYVYDKIKEIPNDPAAVAGQLLLYSLKAGSKDNHSAIIVQFKNGKGYETKDEFVAGPFRPFQNDKAFVDAYFADAAKHGYTGDALMELVSKSEANNHKDDLSLQATTSSVTDDATAVSETKMTAVQSLFSRLTGADGANDINPNGFNEDGATRTIVDKFNHHAGAQVSLGRKKKNKRNKRKKAKKKKIRANKKGDKSLI